MPDEYGEKIEALANSMGLKKSDIARLAVRQFIDQNLGVEETTPYDRVKHLLGTTESGVRDLGQRHREHLVKKLRKKS
jgi:hypothetical protein